MLSSSSSKSEKRNLQLCVLVKCPLQFGMRDFPYLNARIRDFKDKGKVGGGGGLGTWD